MYVLKSIHVHVCHKIIKTKYKDYFEDKQDMLINAVLKSKLSVIFMKKKLTKLSIYINS